MGKAKRKVRPAVNQWMCYAILDDNCYGCKNRNNCSSCKPVRSAFKKYDKYAKKRDKQQKLKMNDKELYD